MPGLLELLSTVLPQKENKGAVQQMGDTTIQLSNEQRTIDYLSKKFKDPAIVSGIMGNIDVETGGTFSHEQKEKGGSGKGLFQFTYKPMKQAYSNFISKIKASDSNEAQIDFIHNIMNSGEHYDIGAGNRKKLQQYMKSGDPSLIAKAFSDLVERPGIPHIDRRMESAKKYFNRITIN